MGGKKKRKKPHPALPWVKFPAFFFSPPPPRIHQRAVCLRFEPEVCYTTNEYANSKTEELGGKIHTVLTI